MRMYEGELIVAGKKRRLSGAKVKLSSDTYTAPPIAHIILSG